MPPLSQRRLTVSIVLVALGVGMIVCLGLIVWWAGIYLSEWAANLLFFGGGALIGAGLLTPIKRPILGLALGCDGVIHFNRDLGNVCAPR